MNIRTARMVYRLGTMAYGRYRNLDEEKRRNVYEALRAMALNEGAKNDQDDAVSAALPKKKVSKKAAEARREAGEVTRAAHDRLDARRAAFATMVQDKKVIKGLEKKAKKEKNKKRRSTIGKSVGILTLLSAIAAAVYYYFFREDDSKPAPKPGQKNLQPAPVKAPEKKAEEAPKEHSHGPLSEEPAERDEELLSSIDEQLSTLETLDDDQRKATEPRG